MSKDEDVLHQTSVGVISFHSDMRVRLNFFILREYLSLVKSRGDILALGEIISANRNCASTNVPE